MELDKLSKHATQVSWKFQCLFSELRYKFSPQRIIIQEENLDLLQSLTIRMMLGHALEHRKDIQTPICSSFLPFFFFLFFVLIRYTKK